MERFCNLYKTVEEARRACECQCAEYQLPDSTYYECAHGSCTGFHCAVCGKFEEVYKW